MNDAKSATRTGRRIPGEPGIWFLLTGDLFVFTTFFSTYLYYRAFDAETYALSQANLSPAFGTINTIVLLTSSLLAALAVEAIRQGHSEKSPRLFAGAIATGVLFVVVKAFEWSAKIETGIYPTTNEFYMYYYMFTGIHLIHVLAGIGLLMLVFRDAQGPSVNEPETVRWIEVAATFWHLVDLLWIIIFALLYVVH